MAMWRMGLDVGSTTTKGVALDPDGRVAARALRPTGDDARAAARAVAARLREAAGGDAAIRVVATGYGRALVDGADRIVTEITCHARGARALCPDAALIVEVGGQDAKAIRLAADGSVDDFAMNDRCAAGTGSFLDVMARRLGGPGEGGEGGGGDPSAVWARIAGGDDTGGGAPTLEINSTCVVFAESEVVGLVARGEPPARVLRAVARAAANRISLLARQVRGAPPAVCCGGGALNPVLVAALADALGFPLTVPSEPQFAGAFGAALLA